MTQEDKELLLKDLCGRLPYDVIVYDYDREETREMGLGTLHDIMFNDLECKPYLRPMSSMTEEEKNEHFGRTMTIDIVQTSKEVIDWLNAHHFDYRNLIKKGLAIEATEGMYNLKEK